MLMVEMNNKKQIEAAILNYSLMYLERRNKIMLYLKYGIIPIFEEMSHLPFRQSLYAFLICKKAYLEIKEFHTKIKQRANLFGITSYLAEFGASKEYINIEKQIESDLETIQANALTLLLDIDSCSREMEA